MADAFTVAAVKRWLQVTGTGQDDVLSDLVAVVRDRIDALPSAPRGKDGAWTARTVQAAVMLTGRLYRRRNSPAGVEALTEGSATYVARWDPDIAALLRIGSYAPPRVG